MSYDFFSMNTISENAVLHHRLFIASVNYFGRLKITGGRS